jgi:hypothetical protein
LPVFALQVVNIANGLRVVEIVISHATVYEVVVNPPKKLSTVSLRVAARWLIVVPLAVDIVVSEGTVELVEARTTEHRVVAVPHSASSSPAPMSADVERSATSVKLLSPDPNETLPEEQATLVDRSGRATTNPASSPTMIQEIRLGSINRIHRFMTSLPNTVTGVCKEAECGR